MNLYNAIVTLELFSLLSDRYKCKFYLTIKQTFPPFKLFFLIFIVFYFSTSRHFVMSIMSTSTLLLNVVIKKIYNNLSKS